MSLAKITPSQTVGPFFHRCLLREGAQCGELCGTEAAGKKIRIEGKVVDGTGAPVVDAVLEIWQAGSDGHHRQANASAGFIGFGRMPTDAGGAYCFETVKPGAVPFDGSRTQAPHICIAVFARGLLNHLFTRIYFADEPANETDPILNRVPGERRGTLLARPQTGGTGSTAYRFDIVLQGTGETVFFNC